MDAAKAIVPVPHVPSQKTLRLYFLSIFYAFGSFLWG
jgi:hypothetical protein